MLSRRHLLSAMPLMTASSLSASLPASLSVPLPASMSDATPGSLSGSLSGSMPASQSPPPSAAPNRQGAPPSAVLSVRGADLSSLLQEEAVGRRFRDRGREAPAERLLAARGAGTVRLRVWVGPRPGDFDLASALVLARRAHAAGLRVLLDLHYSDSWADESNQAVPKAWAGQDLPTLADTVRTYTRDTVRAFAAQGTPVDMVQIGNEITNGMLWPQGQIYTGGGDGTAVTENWHGFLTLLKAGLQGAAQGTSAPPRTVVHFANGCDGDGSRYFYDHLAAAGIRFDVLAVSYYAFWHGPLASLKYNLTDLATRYGKDILVAETSYPWKLPSTNPEQYHVASADQLPDGALFPATPAGQTDYFDALRDLIARLPGGHGLGFLAWEPAWLPGVTRNSDEEILYSNLTMFDWSGSALPSLAAFRTP